jgi:hypothetical protein
VKDTVQVVVLAGLAALVYFALQASNPDQFYKIGLESNQTLRGKNVAKNSGFTEERESSRADSKISSERKNRKSQNANKDTSEEVASLPSIYAHEKVKTKVSKIGVPLEAWFASRKHQIDLPEVSKPAPTGIRIFVQCMELKKGGATPLNSQSDCEALLAKK